MKQNNLHKNIVEHCDHVGQPQEAPNHSKAQAGGVLFALPCRCVISEWNINSLWSVATQMLKGARISSSNR